MLGHVRELVLACYVTGSIDVALGGAAVPVDRDAVCLKTNPRIFQVQSADRGFPPERRKYRIASEPASVFEQRGETISVPFHAFDLLPEQEGNTFPRETIP